MASIAPACLLPTWWASPRAPCSRGCCRMHVCVRVGLLAPSSASPCLGPCMPVVGAVQGCLSPAAQDAKGTPAGTGTPLGVVQLRAS